MSFVIDNSIALAWCGLLTAERRGRISALPIIVDDETTSRLWLATAHLAASHRLTAYDATYLELALRAARPLATTDKTLIAATQNTGVAVLPTPEPE